jgi:hypothetical protein
VLLTQIAFSIKEKTIWKSSSCWTKLLIKLKLDIIYF